MMRDARNGTRDSGNFGGRRNLYAKTADETVMHGGPAKI
jgi:hypothetical protein